VFVDVHSHVVPSGDDGARSVEEGIALCREAARRGTRILFATPHVWPQLGLSAEREASTRAAYEQVRSAAAVGGLELRLGFELTPSPALLGADPQRYRLNGLDAVLMEVPFHGSLELAERLGAHIEGSGLTPVIAHPERSERIIDAPALAAGLRERGWLLQVNATSLLGYHGPTIEASAWGLLDDRLVDLVASDGHRAARPPHLDDAYELVRERVGEGADALFDGRALGLALAAADRFDLAQRR
jgi:protein-tyrosine phosphatase